MITYVKGEPLAVIPEGISKNILQHNLYWPPDWRKLKGVCIITFQSGALREAEVHWYEGHGVGKKEVKIKKYL